MATADLKILYGGGGNFVPSFFSGRLQVASGASGTLFTLTAPVGKRVRLAALITSPTGTESNISIVADGVTVVTNLTLSNGSNTAVGNFSIGYPYQSSGQGAGDLPYIQANSTIVVSKTTGSTTTTIAYCYAYGD